MTGSEKEVRFDIYCEKCEYYPLSESDSPCWECLDEPLNIDSHKPLHFKEKTKKETESR